MKRAALLILSATLCVPALTAGANKFDAIVAGGGGGCSFELMSWEAEWIGQDVSADQSAHENILLSAAVSS